MCIYMVIVLISLNLLKINTLKVILRIFLLILISQFFALCFMLISTGCNLFDIGEMSSVEIPEIINNFGLKPYLFLSQLFSIFIPSIVFIYLLYPKNFFDRIKIELPFDRLFFMYGIMFLLLSYPLIQFSAEINKVMPFSNWMSDASDKISILMKEILVMDGIGDFIINIIIIALIPAIGEELLFRAALQNELIDGIKNKDVAIILAAIIFSAFHFQFDGFLPRFFLGLILGYLYYWSGSIWLPIFVHFFNNSMIIVSAFFMQDKLDTVFEESSDEIPKYILLMSIVAVFVLRRKLIEMSRERIEKMEDEEPRFNKNE